MIDVILILTCAVLGILGFFVMKRLDLFMTKNEESHNEDKDDSDSDDWSCGA